jgi:hypothetical protein
MKALISPNEPVSTGYRLAEVREQSFDVAEPLFWIDCGENIIADVYYYDPADQTIKETPIAPFQNMEAAPNQPAGTGSQTL